jgi:hypothetical protein
MTKTFILILVLVIITSSAFAGRNAKLENLADETWLNVCAFDGYPTDNGGAAEVPWTYDANSKIFVRLGGCTNVYNNAVVFFDMGIEDWEIAWPYDNSAPAHRPGCGCNRGLCYDPVTKCVWQAGGASSGCHGNNGIWKGDMAARTWTSIPGSVGQQGHVAVDPVTQKIVFTYWDIGSYQHCKIWDLQADSLRPVPPKPGTTETEWVALGVDYWQALEYVPCMNGVMYVAHAKSGGWYTWLLDTETETWTDLNPSGLPSTYGRAILSYDPMGQVVLLKLSGLGLYVYTPTNNTWEQLTTSNDPTGGGSEMFEYDSEHNVHVFCALYPSNRVWAFRYKNDPVSEGEIAGQSIRITPGLTCIPNPVQGGTHIRYWTPTPANALLSIYRLDGTLVDRLMSRSKVMHSIRWQATEKNGTPLANGTYILKVEAGENRVSKRVIVIR